MSDEEFLKSVGERMTIWVVEWEALKERAEQAERERDEALDMIHDYEAGARCPVCDRMERERDEIRADWDRLRDSLDAIVDRAVEAERERDEARQAADYWRRYAAGDSAEMLERFRASDPFPWETES